MTVYYINLLLILALAYPLCVRNPSDAKKAAYIALTFGWMWFIATFRYGIGFDYYSYIRIFEQVRELPYLAAVRDFGLETGFTLLTKVMTLFIGDASIQANTTMMYGVYQAAILLPVMWFVYKHCKDAWLAA